jgi:hypothetical protein
LEEVEGWNSPQKKLKKFQKKYWQIAKCML